MKLNNLLEEKAMSYFRVKQDMTKIFELLNLQPAMLSGDGESPTRLVRSFFIDSEDWSLEQGFDYALPYENRCKAFLKKLATILKGYAEEGYAVGFTPVETKGVTPDKIYEELVRHVEYTQYYSNKTLAQLGAAEKMPKVYFNISRVKKPSEQGTDG
jgi:hypothetical protein